MPLRVRGSLCVRGCVALCVHAVYCRGPEDVVALVASSMPSNTKLAVFDAVTSNTALVMPVQELVQLCRDRLVEGGAHRL